MPTIYMQHAEHGGTHVYTEVDAVAHEARGWKRANYPKVERPEPPPPAIAAPLPPDNRSILHLNKRR